MTHPRTHILPRLPRHLALLLLEALEISGTIDPRDTLGYIEEKLTVDEHNDLCCFLGWLQAEGLSIGHGNVEARYAAYRASVARARSAVDSVRSIDDS